MIPATMLLGLFWQYCAHWLRRMGAERDAMLPFLGWLASLFLLIYTLALGHDSENFRLLRRAGIIVFIGFTFIVQVRVAGALRQIPALAAAGVKLLGLSAMILVVGLVSVLLDIALGSAYDRMEDAFEWWLILLLILHLFLTVRWLSPALDP